MVFYHFIRYVIYFFCLLYFRIEFYGLERVPSDGPVIFAPNHASYLDPIWVSVPLRRRLRYMTWERLFRVPLLAPMMRAFGAFPVKIEVGDRGALRLSREHLESGGALMIFPEGGRTRTGNLMPFKMGVIRLALETRAPIVPVTIIGGYRAFSPWHRLPRPYKLKVFYHEPIAMKPPEGGVGMKSYLRARSAELQSVVASSWSTGK